MHKLYLPRLGQTMEEALLVGWLVEPGQDFAAGTPLYEVETEKVTTGVEATVSGRLVRLLAEPDDRIEVGALLAVIAEPGESPADADIDRFLRDEDDGEPPGPAPAELPADPAPVRPVEVARAAVPEAAGEVAIPVRAMPRTRALARELGVDLTPLARQAGGGLVTEEQVRAAATASEPAATAACANPVPDPVPAPQQPVTPALAGVRVRERRRLSPIARRMADVVSRSWSEVPQFSQSVQVDAGSWRARRDALRQQTGVDIGYTDLVLAALVRAVQEVPEVNSTFAGDHLVVYRDINVSVAVDTPAGLQVPVLHGLQDYTVEGIARRLREKTRKAREDALTADDVRGGTITFSNLGRYGIEGGMPLVTAPQTCIVFVGALVDRVVAVNGGVAVRPGCTVVNSFDHRSVDGATAARFTAALRRALEEI